MGINAVSTLISESLTRIQVTSADTRLTYANLLGYAQRVYEDLYYSIALQNPEIYGDIGYLKFYANNTSAQLSANLTNYDQSMNFLKLEFKSDSNANYYPGMEISFNEITSPLATYYATSPVFSVYGDKVFMQPAPTADLVSCGRAYFTKRASALSGGSATNLPDVFEEVLVNGICKHGFDQLGDQPNSQKFLQEYQTAKELKLRIINRKSRTRGRIKDIRENYFGNY